MAAENNLYGLIACGGKSSRMGQDKSMLLYYDMPQCYQLYEMLVPFCEKVFISCNETQAAKTEPGYPLIIDLPSYKNTGPMAALLSAFALYPKNDFLLIGCDYPFLTKKEISDFLHTFQRNEMAAAFFNPASSMYEPLLGYYNQRSAIDLLEMEANNEYSLQHFLRKINAAKFFPSNIQVIQSVDTIDEFNKVKKIISVI